MSSSEINNFIDKVNSITHENAKQILTKIYTNDIVFIDPVKSIEGLDSLTTYFEDLYKSLTSCHFTLKNHTLSNRQHSIEWRMRFQHRKIGNNLPLELDGASFIKFDNSKVCYHRDYYDLGALVYEHIPILGSVIKRVRHAI